MKTLFKTAAEVDKSVVAFDMRNPDSNTAVADAAPEIADLNTGLESRRAIEEAQGAHERADCAADSCQARLGHALSLAENNQADDTPDIEEKLDGRRQKKSAKKLGMSEIESMTTKAEPEADELREDIARVTAGETVETQAAETIRSEHHDTVRSGIEQAMVRKESQTEARKESVDEGYGTNAQTQQG